MKIYLVRHGDYLDQSVDPNESLSPSGAADIQLLKTFFKKLKIEFDVALCSPKKRSRETAEILRGDSELIETPLMKPMAIPEETINAIPDNALTVLLAGHLPSLETIASNFGSELEFPTGGCALIEDHHLKWLITPQILKSI